MLAIQFFSRYTALFVHYELNLSFRKSLPLHNLNPVNEKYTHIISFFVHVKFPLEINNLLQHECPICSKQKNNSLLHNEKSGLVNFVEFIVLCM
jgi:hypothetical protein